MATPWRPRLPPLAPAGNNTSLNSDISMPAGTQAKEHAVCLEHAPISAAGKGDSCVGPHLPRLGARQAFDACNVLTWECWASRHSKVVSLACGTFSQVATLRSATRALASYHLTTGSRATPCFADLFVTLPACNTCPQQPPCLQAQGAVSKQQSTWHSSCICPDSDRGFQTHQILHLAASPLHKRRCGLVWSAGISPVRRRHQQEAIAAMPGSARHKNQM